MSWTRRAFLGSAAAAAALSPRGARGADPSAPKHLIVMIADGGWDVTFSVDPKPRDGRVDGPWVDETQHPDDVEYTETVQGIPLQLNDHKRPAVSAFFRNWGQRACVVNGIWTGSIVHQPSRIRMLTGTTRPDRPDFATLIGFDKGVAIDLPLGTVDFSGLGYAGPLASTSGRIGHSSQLKALLDPDTTYPAPTWADYELPLYVPTDAEVAAIDQHLRARTEAVRARHGDGGNNDHLLDGLLESLTRKQRLLDAGDVLVDPLNLGGKPSLDLQADMAVDLLAAGLCHTVTMAHFDSWDTHDNNFLQHELYNSFFASLNRLAGNLELQGLLDDTLVVVMSEMTRTPRLNRKGGKDHWSHTSMILFGAGVRGGAAVGGTNADVESEPVDLATGEVDPAGALNKYDNLAAGLVEHLGADPAEWFPGVVPFRGPYE
jgi:hypothetical protein